jgi:uncharacterized protein
VGPEIRVTLCLTHDCNLRCRYCYGGVKSARHMPLAIGARAITLALARTARRLHLIFFGGEPLLRFAQLTRLTAIARAACAARGLELRPTVTTNGTLITAARAAWLAAEGFVVGVSCDGTPEGHDANRRDRHGRRTWARTTAGLRRALGAGAAVRAVLVVDPANVARLPAAVRGLRALGADDFVLNPHWGAGWSAALQACWTAAYEEVGRDYVAAYRAGRPFWISVIDEKIHAHLRGGFAESERCDLGRQDLVVAASGNLYPCDRLVGDDRHGRFVIGHVGTGADPARACAWAAAVGAPPADCHACGIAARCRNRCACANVALTGSPDTPSELLCFHEQLAVRTADTAARALFAEANPAFMARHYGRILDAS